MSYKFSADIEIEKNCTIIFDYTQDYSHRLEWDTFLLAAELVPPAIKAEKRARAWCVAVNGYGMETEYVSFQRPKVAAIKMTKGPYMFKEFTGSWNFREINTDKTKVIFLYSFSLRFPYSLIGPFIRNDLRKNVRQRLGDLKACVEKRYHDQHTADNKRQSRLS
jgi:hypothetical protein